MNSFRMLGRGLKMTGAATRSTSNAAERGLAAWTAGRGGKAARRGMIGPWDPPPPAGARDYLDYSGVARPQDIECEDWWFPLGRYVKPKHPWKSGPEIGLPLAAANRHTLVVGPTRAGKTASVIAPWIVAGLRAGYLVVAVDVKGNGDLQAEVTRYRDHHAPGEKFRLLSWDYREPRSSRQWNFIAELDDDSAVNAAAEAICGRPKDDDPNRNFHVRDLKWARGLLELVHDTPRRWTVRDLLALLADPQALRDLVDAHPRSRGAQRLRDLALLPDDEYARATQFLSTHFEVLNTNGFNAVTAGHTLDLRRVAHSGSGLVLVNAPVADGMLSEAASGLFLSMLVQRRLAAFRSGGAPMLLVLDESKRLQDRMELSKVLALAGGADVSVLMAAQDVSQYHEPDREEILANCGTVVLLPKAGKPSVDHVMQRLGNRVGTKRTASESYDRRNGRSTSYGTDSHSVPVLDHAALTNHPSGRFGATVVSASVSARPILVDLTREDIPPT